LKGKLKSGNWDAENSLKNITLILRADTETKKSCFRAGTS